MDTPGADIWPVAIEAGGTLLSAVAHLPAVVPAPVVVCSHGLLSTKESQKFISVCNALASEGFCSLRFDFSGCGQSGRRSGAGLIDARRRDLASVMAFALKQPYSDGRLGLFGSSLGGFLSLLAANERPEMVFATVSWSAPFDVGSKHARKVEEIFPEGLGSPADLTGLDRAGRVLLLHGQSDEIVPWTESVQIYNRLKDPSRLFLLRNADHRIREPSWRTLAIRETMIWFSAHEGQKP